MRGQIIQRSPGSWSLKIYLGRDENGKEKQKWITVRGTKKQAQAELTRILHELNTGAFVEPAKQTVSVYLEQWLEDYAKVNVSPKTFDRYQEIVRNHLKPNLGRVLLAKLTPLHIQSYYSQALQSGRRDGKGGLSAQTVLHHHRVLHQALRQAVKWRLITWNPADAAEPPEPVEKEMQTTDEEGVVRLLELAADGWIYIPILIAATTGMRRGEVLGLRWSDLTLNPGSPATGIPASGTAYIVQATEQVGTTLRFKAPKTEKSKRRVELGSFLVEELIRHRGRQAELRLQLGEAYDNQGLVVAREDGKPYMPDSFSHAFARLSRQSGIGVRLHDLRHSHATQLFKESVHPKIVSERLGHASVQITLDRYSHVVPGMQAEAARLTDTALRKALRQRDGDRPDEDISAAG